MKKFSFIVLSLLAGCLISSAWCNPLHAEPDQPAPAPTPVNLQRSRRVGLLTSPPTFKALGWRWEWEWSGAAHCLDELKVDYEVVTPATLGSWNGELLILPNVRNMSPHTVALVKSKNVPLLATYMSSYRGAGNEAWNPDNFALADRFGADFQSWVGSGTRADRIKLDPRLGEKEMLLGRGRAMMVRPRSGSRVLATWPGGEAAIVESQGGIYVGEDIFCPENSDSRLVLDLIGRLMNRLKPGIASVPGPSTFSRLPQPPLTPIKTSGKTVRVGLGKVDSEVLFRAGKSLTVNGEKTPGFYRWAGGTGELKVAGSPYIEVLKLRASGTYAWHAYRGSLSISKEGQLINTVDMEEYLAGVVPSEVPSTYPAEALKSMAVVARTYGVTHLNRHQGYDVCSTVHCQVYGGLDQEALSTNQAIAATSGERVVFEGKPADTVFHAVCGGSTAAPEQIWPGAAHKPYLKSVPDLDPVTHQAFCSASGRFHWEEDFTGRQLVETLRSGLQGELGSRFTGLSRLLSIKVDPAPGGRVGTMEIEGPEGSYRIQGDAVRWLFSGGKVGTGGLQSTLFKLEKTKTGYRFEGGGWGHGVGLCQEGASGRARAGQDYKTILLHYYPGTELKRG